MSETTVDHLAEAQKNIRGRIPQEILQAFLPGKQTVFGRSLVPLSAGHHLLMVQLGHPLVNESKLWAPEDIPLAMFVFTRRSNELFQLIANDTFDAEFYDFLESLPCAEMGDAIQTLVAHWLAATTTALPMTSPYAAAQKKTAASVGG